MKFPTGYVVDTMNTTDLIEMRPTHKLVPDGEGLPIALCRSGSDAARIANGLRLLEQDEQAPQYSIDTSALDFTSLSLRPGRILKVKTTVTLPESEILARAREAAIASAASLGRSYGLDNIRAGSCDGQVDIRAAIRALRDLAKPLSEVVPAVDGDLVEARKVAAARASKPDEGDPLGTGCAARAERIMRGDADKSRVVVDALAAIRRGRELEREARG